MSGLLAAMERPRIGSSNTVFKSGPLFISSKGISWKSWKKRWFILTRTSLVFFKNDPSSLQQRGGEVNLTLGGIDLNNSGRVVVREDKKLLTVLFPDGRDGRAFTLKSESSEDLYDWKTALEQALAQAPSPAAVMGNNGIFLNDPNDSESSLHHWREKRGVKSVVVGRPILLALEDIDGGPSFLEKAFQFLEKYGSRVEGILRQSADVEEVEQRVKDYERGKNEFDSEEDAHIVGDCIKHVLRELPSSPVPASCCIALLEAYKIPKKEARINAIRSAIFESFPEPNRNLLHRTMKMMHTVCTYSSENRMTPSAVAACMAPLLLRPLLAGECEFDDDFDVGGDSSYQLRAAANAANSAQAIIATLLDEYENIFNDDSLQRYSISSDSRLLRSISECSTDYDILNGDDSFRDSKIKENESDDERGRAFSVKSCRSSCVENDHYDYQALDGNRLDSKLYIGSISFGDSEQVKTPIVEFVEKQSIDFGSSCNDMDVTSTSPSRKILQSMGDILFSENAGVIFSPPRVFSSDSSVTKVKKTSHASKRSRFWRRNDARTVPSRESVDSSGEDELAIQRLEVRRNELLQSIASEIQRNEVLHYNLDRRKHDLHERRISLQQDVCGLQNQLKAEKDLKTALEAVMNMYSESNSSGLDSKMRAELVDIASAEEDMTLLKQKVSELLHQLNQQQQRQRQVSSNVEHTGQSQNHTYKQKFCQGNVDVDATANKNGNDLSDGGLSGSSGHLSTSTKCDDPASRQHLSDAGMRHPSTMGTKVKVVRSTRRRRTRAPLLNDLTLKLDFFKERKAHLMHQLHNLNLNYGSHDVAKTSPPPPWA